MKKTLRVNETWKPRTEREGCGRRGQSPSWCLAGLPGIRRRKASVGQWEPVTSGRYLERPVFSQSATCLFSWGRDLTFIKERRRRGNRGATGQGQISGVRPRPTTSIQDSFSCQKSTDYLRPQSGRKATLRGSFLDPVDDGTRSPPFVDALRDYCN